MHVLAVLYAGFGSLQKNTSNQTEKENSYKERKGFRLESHQGKGDHQTADWRETEVKCFVFWGFRDAGRENDYRTFLKYSDYTNAE